MRIAKKPLSEHALHGQLRHLTGLKDMDMSLVLPTDGLCQTGDETAPSCCCVFSAAVKPRVVHGPTADAQCCFLAVALPLRRPSLGGMLLAALQRAAGPCRFFL